MKKFIFLISFFLIIITTFGQRVTYTANDLAQAGDAFGILKIQYDSTNMMAINEVDPNMWDYSSIIAEADDTVYIYSKDEFPELSDLPEGTMVMQQDDESYMCMYLNGDMLEMLGLLIDLNGTLTPMIFPEAQNMLHLPLTIGEGGSSNLIFPIQGTPEEFGIDIPFHDSVRFDISVDATSLVEDTGTVKTFQYQKSAFKVANTTIFSVDVWALPSFGGWYLLQENVVADTTKIVQYYAPNYGIPLIELALTWNDSILSYRMIEEEPQAIANHSIDKVEVYPNPVSANQKLRFNRNLTNISIYDITGRLIKQYEGTHRQIILSNLPDGYYILKSERPFTTKRIIID